jgi:UDP-glucuronate 4-epimerase
MTKVLITGIAGFIAYHLCKKLLNQGNYQILGLDNINDYYDVSLKKGRLNALGLKGKDFDFGQVYQNENLEFRRIHLQDKEAVKKAFASFAPDMVVHLAAQAGVRYSLENPQAYIDSNIQGFMNIIEECRHVQIKHLIYASTSAVYGLNKNMPFSVKNGVNHPISLYGATKKANEMMAHSYSYLFGIPTTGLRFFTVYGPWGRPDMALFLFTNNILKGKSIDVYNNGKMIRDFTYVEDIVEGISRLIHKIPEADPDFNPENPDPSTSVAPFKIHNIGNHNPVNLMDFISVIEKETGKKALMHFMPLQAGDVVATYADVSTLTGITGFTPNTPIETGVKNYVSWFRTYYNV